MITLKNFYSLLRSLQRYLPEKTIKFNAVSDYSFPIGDIGEASFMENEIIIPQNLFNLAGQNAVLPDYMTELLLANIENKQFAMRDFFDIFNNRLLQLYYLAWQKSQFYISYENDALTQIDYTLSLLISLIGIKINTISDVYFDLFLHHSGILTLATRTKDGLSTLLYNYFLVPNTIVEFTGCWLKIEDSERSQLSTKNNYNQLGVNCALGQRIWLAQNGFTISIGMISYLEFIEFFPDQAKLKTLSDIVKMYVGREYFFFVIFEIQFLTIPKLTLKHGNLYLGWNSWLITQSDLDKTATVTLRI